MSDMDDIDEFNNKVISGYEGRDREANEPSVLDVADETRGITNESRNIKSFDFSMWAVYGGDRYSACETAVNVLPAGQYTVEASQTIGIHFRKTNTNLDELMNLPDSASESVINEVKAFWSKEQHFRRFGFLWKRGFLLWGPPGSGKTTTVQLISQFVVSHNGIALFVTRPSIDIEGLKMMRQIEPKRPIVVILEDIDAIIENYGENVLLALMDGELQIDNVIFIATTNYPERLDKRFVNRPSRFDLIKKIGMPTSEARRIYFSTKNKRLVGQAELDKWVEKTDGFSIAHMKELIVSVEVFGISFDQAVGRLRKMMDIKLSSEQASESTFGFAR